MNRSSNSVILGNGGADNNPEIGETLLSRLCNTRDEI